MRARCALLLLALVSAPGVATPLAACEAGHTRACIVNEDSHPHEVLPGRSADYQIETDRAGQSIFVRCMLSGPVSAVGITFSNVTPQGWAAQNSDLSIGDPIHVEIEGVTTGSGAASFSFLNRDPARLLWHECYNG